jgi:hypothetical protein
MIFIMLSYLPSSQTHSRSVGSLAYALHLLLRLEPRLFPAHSITFFGHLDVVLCRRHSEQADDGKYDTP